MKFSKLLITLFVTLFFLNNCSSFSDAGKVLRNEKRTTTDEFLIKKKGPLTQPPDFEKMPKPNTIEKKADSDRDEIQRILKTNKSKTSGVSTKSSSTENSILERIKK